MENPHSKRKYRFTWEANGYYFNISRLLCEFNNRTCECIIPDCYLQLDTPVHLKSCFEIAHFRESNHREDRPFNAYAYKKYRYSHSSLSLFAGHPTSQPSQAIKVIPLRLAMGV